MNLFRYMDALDRIEGARRGPRGLLDDGWFDTYGSRATDLPPAGQGAAAPFVPIAGQDPVNDWYQARLREAFDASYARLRAQAAGAMPLGRALRPIWPARQDPNAPSIYLLSATQTPLESASMALSLDQSDRAEPPSALLNGDSMPPENRPDDGYPWYGRDGFDVGTVKSSNLPPAPDLLRNIPDAEGSASPEKPFRQLPNPSVEERDLARAERKHRAIVEMWRESGRLTSADHLERFLDGSGGRLVIDRDEARSFAPIRNAEQKNEWRQERAFLIGGEHAHAEKFADLKDGETIKFDDNFKVDYGPGPFVLQTLDPSTTDFATAFGRLGFKSDGNFKATRRGDTIEIEGTVSHGFKDRYDFNPGQPYAAEPNLLERKGTAKSYDRTSSWQRRLTGTIKVDNGRLYSPRFEWEDIEP